MQNRQEILESLKNIMPELRREFGVKSLGIFGSVATGDVNNDSDLDLLVEFEHPPGLRFMDFADKIEHSVSRSVDILTPEGLKSIRQPEIAQSIESSLLYV